MKIHLVVLEVLHEDKHNDNAFLGRPKTRAVPIKLAKNVSNKTEVKMQHKYYVLYTSSVILAIS
jgi:hypothetical protein